MKAILTFASAISDPLRLRLLTLSKDQKVSPSDAGTVLGLAPVELARQMKHLTDAGLIKADNAGGHVRTKRKHQELLEVLFAHFDIVVKKDAVLRQDAKKAKQLIEARHRAEKESRKLAANQIKASATPKDLKATQKDKAKSPGQPKVKN